MKQRILAALLTVVMLLTMLPMTAFASLLENSPAYNQTILSELTELCGGEDEAKRYYGILEQYGLLDESGNATDSWAITLDGEAITLEEIRALLAEKDCDLQKDVVVDGRPISLGDLKTMLEIEDYIAYLRGTYYAGGKWTAEQQASLKSLMAQVNDEGIQMKSAAGATAPSGVSHNARVSVTSTDGMTFTATLSGAVAGQAVTFDYAALSGSQPVSGTDKGKVDLTADGNGSASETFTIDRTQVTTDTVRSTAEPVYYVGLSNLTNALFTNGKTAMAVPCTSGKTVEVFPTPPIVITDEHVAPWNGFYEGASLAFDDSLKNAIKWGLVDTVTLSQSTYTPETLRTEGAGANWSHCTVDFWGKIDNQRIDGEYMYYANETTTDLDKREAPPTKIPNKAAASILLVNYCRMDGWNSVPDEEGSHYPKVPALSISATFTDTSLLTAPSSVTAPAGTYYPGSTVPVTVTFPKPVQSEGATATINSVVCPAAEVGVSNVLTFPYPVQPVDNAALSVSAISATDTAEHKLTDYNPGGTADAGLAMAGVHLQTPNQADAITGLTATIADPQTAPKLTATVSLSDNGKLTTWLKLKAEGTKFVTTNLFASIDGTTKVPLTATSETVTGGTLTADFDLPLNTGGSTQPYTVELWLGDTGENLLFGKAASADLTAAKFVTANDLTVQLSVKAADGKDFDITKTIYAQDNPTIAAFFSLKGSGYSFGNINKVTTYQTDGTTPVDPTAHFVWSSGDTTIANIDRTGKIFPTGKAGTVKFTLTALNGNVEGKQASVSTETLTFGVGTMPFLLISNATLTTVGGQDVTVYWSSNLCDKNEGETAFTVSVTKGSESVHTDTVKGTKEKPAAAVTIRADVLQYDYAKNASNIFTVKITAKYEGKEYSATATIRLESKPAQVKLNQLESYYITDNVETVNISWNISNFDRYSGTADKTELFKLEVMKNGDAATPFTDPGVGSDGAYTGSYSLSNLEVTAKPDVPTSYRDVYTVTIQAKNGNASTWSYDSFLLYVYDAEALQILVDGAAKDSFTMSNKPTIKGMTQAQILALNRDISLKNVISVNYGSYAWSEVADQIAWVSKKNEVATVNYQQGTLYEDIRDFAYVSYRPTTDFLLSGRTDGESVVTATHKLTGMADSVKITVETLKNKLYLFQCYPQTETTLTYTDGAGIPKTAKTDEHGAAAIYEEQGISGDVYCSAVEDGHTYLGTFYQAELKTGEGDAVRLERYPCNNLQLRRAAYAYLYLKKPDGTPYTGDVTFRGGVYVNNVYKKDALFVLNDSTEKQRGDVDTTVNLAADGKLAVTMDQTQWGLTGNALTAGDKVSYVFQIALDKGETTYYPLFTTINATSNEDAFVGSGEAVVTFHQNSIGGKHPFIVQQVSSYANYGVPTSLLDYTGNVGPSGSCPEATLTTAVMWWGDAVNKNPKNTLRLLTETGLPVGDGAGEATLQHTAYPFSKDLITEYSVKLNEETMKDTLTYRKTTGLYLDYLRDGKTLTRHESLPFRLCNMINSGKIEDQEEIGELLGKLGEAAGTGASSMDFGDEFVNIALSLAAGDSYTTGDKKLFQIQLAPTSDPTKFLGFIQMNVGNMENNITGIYADSESRKSDFGYVPGPTGLMVLAGIKKPMAFAMDQMSDYNKVLKRKAVSNVNFKLDGYAESLIYFNDGSGKWEIQILNGGFKAGGGMNYTWNWNFWCGPIPCTTSLSIGGSAVVGMDALTVAYYNAEDRVSGIGNDFLTELRIYLYLNFFAGVGFDYSIIAFKLGIYGQINLDMRFQWLNRPYMDTGDPIINRADGLSNEGNAYNLNGQKFKIDGQIGMKFLMKFLFFSYEKILFSTNFSLLDKSTGQWDTIQTSWAANKAANKKAIGELLKNGSLSTFGAGEGQMLALNLAPTVESRDYLDEGGRFWGPGISLFSLDAESALEQLESNTYPYANPVLSDDGALVAYLSDGGNTDSAQTRATYGVLDGTSYENKGVISEGGYGDSQLSLSGNQSFAAAAWTRQSVNLNKDSGAVVTDADQMMVTNGTEVYASVYNGSTWATTALSTNSSPDLAPVVATNGKSGDAARAIVAWRSVAASGNQTGGENAGQVAGVTTFDQKDTIVYKLYNGSKWDAEARTLYNGTSGAVKGIVAAMLTDGTPAVAYTLDTDQEENTTNDREIVYATLDQGTGEVTRNVQATNDGYLDENPQLTAVTFPKDDKQRFVLGWYSEQAVTSDTAAVLNAGSAPTGKATTADIRLRDFTAEGITEQLLPDSISQVADSYGVAITSNFRFTKNAASISDLSILWAERAAGELVAIPETPSAGKAAARELTAERDVLKGIKFYTDAKQNVRFTGAVDVAEMPAATLIDHFDAYVSNSATNEIKAAVLGTTYGAATPEVKTGVTVGGDTVQYTVPDSTSTMYTATETYTDKIEVPAVLPDYETVKKGATTQLQFTVDNRGIHGITELSITVGDKTTTHSDLNLLPGGSILLAADYLVPPGGVVDPDYTVTATFSDTAGAKGTAETEAVGRRGASVDLTQATGKVYLNLPDVAITDAKIVDEEGGKRTIQLKLNNHSDADLIRGVNSVKVSFFKDVTCAEPFKESELPPITISSAADLAMLNDGGYSTQFAFDVGAYVKGEKLTEIPESGVAIYCKAEVLDDKGAAQGEPITTDNFASVTCESLQLRSETAVALTSDLAVQDGKTVVTVTLQNNRLSQTQTGNLIVTLLDANGKVLEQQQSYQGERRRSGNGLITLTGEKTHTQTFTFNQPGASVQTTYSDVLLANDNAKLSSISFTTIPGITLASFTESQETPGTYTAQVSTNDLTATTVIAVTESGRSKAKVVGTAGTASNAISQEVSLTPGGNTTITVTVTAQNQAVKTYLLTVQNKLPQPDGGGAGSGGGADSGGSGGGGGDSATAHPIHVAQSPHGTVSVSPRSAFPGDTVTITAVPEKGYQPEAVALVLQNGKELTTGKQSEGRYSFKMPDCAVNVTVSFVPQTCDGGDKCPSRSFTDVDQSLWYHSAIDYAVAHKFFSGTGATNFTPNGTMTRGMLVTVLYRAAGKPSMEHEIWGYPFADVDVNSYCGTAVYWARLHEIVGGYAGGERFGPNDPQMAAILYRYALSEGRDVTASTDLTKFTDSASIGSYAKTALSWACANGFLQGSDGALLPQNNATRAQVAAVLMRYSRSAPVK